MSEQTFGAASVAINPDCGGCVVTITRAGIVDPNIRRVQFHSLDEIDGALGAQMMLAAKSREAGDFAAALRFAGQMLHDHQSRKRS